MSTMSCTEFQSKLAVKQLQELPREEISSRFHQLEDAEVLDFSCIGSTKFHVNHEPVFQAHYE